MEVFSSSFYIDWNKKVRLVDRVRLVVPVPVTEKINKPKFAVIFYIVLHIIACS